MLICLKLFFRSTKKPLKYDKLVKICLYIHSTQGQIQDFSRGEGQNSTRPKENLGFGFAREKFSSTPPEKMLWGPGPDLKKKLR